MSYPAGTVYNRFHKFLVKNIEDLFTKLDLPAKFINQQPVSINSVWALLHEDFCKNWEDNIKIMPNLRTYIKFKNVFEIEPYVLSFMSRQHRSYLAQLRNGILPLQLEVDRSFSLNENLR